MESVLESRLYVRSAEVQVGYPKLRFLFLTVALVLVVFGSCLVPSMGQGVTAGYTLYVSFFYPLHFLYNLQVTILDQTGRIIGTGMSSDGSMIIIPVRTERPTFSLSASALGYASGPITYYVTNPQFWVVAGTSTIPVATTGGDYWITINLIQ
jgi:hypothetical protein